MAFVGFSGGADSTALLLATQLCGIPVTAVHFNHHLRGADADADAQWCREFCEARNIPFIAVDLQVNQERLPGESLETAARRLRLREWHNLTRDGGTPVFLAHHLDDCLEELFLRLARGANCSGLTGMKPMRRMADGTLLCRPLLKCRKSELEDFLRE
ncbi:MAG: tRNA lysidine(34) synthetase TilS, partial [Victivallales bacterium]|nr:tRNA lysidine(34) synthetase TilS [Victivallales bacterium]